ncbi:MAG: choice-of-anchor J domain-containing protein [Candidatus Cloacimonetes bacterium]|nr:choice-of-anchor J domain-containing protein [Candidatus Cloacimonadota bacterium]
MKKVVLTVFLALIATLLFGQFENSIITCSSAAVNTGDDFAISISTTELEEDWNITAFQFNLDFDPTIISYSGFIAGEVVAGSGSLLANQPTPGHIIVAFAHYQPISGIGDLITLNFNAIDEGNTVLDLNQFKYNATYLANANLIDGNVMVTVYNPFQDVVITAGSGSTTIGNNIVIPITTTMLTTDMGAISFQFDLVFDDEVLSYESFSMGTVPNPGNLIANESSPGVVSVAYANVMPISGEGTLCNITFSGAGVGTTVLDLNEFKYNSTYLYNLVNGNVEVAAYNPYEDVVITAGSANAAIGAGVEIPVSTTLLTTEMGAISFQFNLTFDNSLLSFDSFSLGEVPGPGNLIANESAPGVISVAYANVMPITGEGNLCYLTFIADVAGSSALELSLFKYNSSYLNNLIDGSIMISSVQYPDWTVNPNAFEYNGSIWGRVELDDVPVTVTSGMLGCFVDDECRGVASLANGSIIDYTTPFGHVAFMPMIFSDVTSGEMLDFYYFDAETEAIYNVAESMEFIADMVVGNGMNPFVFHASTINTVDVTKNMVPGWNWLSLNVIGDDMSVNSVLTSVGGDASYIKSQTQYATYYAGMGWFGTLNTINNTTFYKLDVSNNTTFEYTGIPVDLNDTIYNLSSGWNWISYAPQVPEATSYALEGLNGAGSYIKSQTQYSTYYAGMGWFGTLNNMVPLAGYMLDMSIPTQFNYPAPDVTARTVVNNVTPVNNDLGVSTQSRDRVPEWTVNPYDYEYNGSIWGTVAINGIPCNDVNDWLGAFVDGECRGVANYDEGSVIDYTIPFGHIAFMPMIFSNVTSGETLTFQYYDASQDLIFDVTETMDFVADMVIGNGLTPFEFHVETGGNLPPSANAGVDQSVYEGDLVTLDGSASSDPEMMPLTYLWTAPAGITLDDATAVMPTFTAPDVDMDMEYTFTLVVNDGELNSLVDEVVVTVMNIWTFEESMIIVSSDDVIELEEFEISVSTSPIDESWNVIAFQFDLDFDPAVISYEGFSMGEVPNGGSIIANELTPGHVRVAYAHYLNLSGVGTLCNLEFQAIGMGGSTVLDIYEFKYNQTYMTNLVDGLVNVEPLPNHTPTIELPDSFYFVTNETLTVDFSMYVDDVDGDDLVLDYSGNTDIMVTITDLMVEFSAPADWTGSETLTFSVDDGYSRDVAFDDVDIVVTLPDPILEFDLPETLSLVTESSVMIDFEEYILYANLDPASLTLEVTGNSNIGVIIDGFEVTFNSTTWIGSENMTFTVSNTEISASDDVMVSVVDFLNSVLTVESLTVDDGMDFDVAISSSVVDPSWNVIAYQCSLSYDTNYLSWNDVTVENTFAPGTVLGNEIQPGFVNIAYMHYQPLDGEGPICYLNFTAHGIGETNIHIWAFKYNSTFMLPENQHDGVIMINDVGIQYVPIADAGEDQSVIGGDFVTLDGSGSFDMNGDALTYAWTAPAGITLSSTTVIMPTFTAPENTMVVDYTFSLVVTDNDGASDPDEVVVTVIPPNMPPVAMAGDDVSWWENLTVTLDGTGSYDPDGDPITYMWTGAGLTFDDPTSATPVVTLPNVNDDTDYTVTLTVNDGFLNGTDNLTITVMNVTIPLNPPSNLAVENMDDGEALFTWNSPAGGDVLEEGFEVWPPAGWVFVDDDGDSYGWDDGGELGLDAHTGDGLAYSASYINDIGALNPDNWLISPAVTFSGSGSVNYFVCAQDAAWAGEHYGVYISDSGTDPDDFDLLFEETMTARSTGRVERIIPKGTRVQGAWYERTVDIDGYSGACYIAFRHFNCTDMFYLDLDDVTITPTLGASRELAGYNVYLDGLMVGSTTAAVTEFLFEDLIDGNDYEAGVVAVYDEGFSPMVTLDFTYIANQAPVADAGNDQTVRDGMQVTLNGSASFDPDGDPITYLWTAPAGITLSSTTVAMPTFTAPEITNETDYSFTLQVSDGEYTDSDVVVITVQQDEPGNVEAVHLTNPAFVQLTWEAPEIGGETGEWVHYDSGMNDDGIGLTSGGSFVVAARWAAGDLDDYDGMQITKMNFFPRGITTGHVAKIWTGANAANVVVSQNITDYTSETWNEIYYTTPYTIDSSLELWVGYTCDAQPAGEYPAGCDAGPAIAGFGDMISQNGGVSWDPLSGFGLDYNWNIQAWVAGAARALPLASAPQTPEVTSFFTSEDNIFACGNLGAPAITTRDERSFLLGFYVYLDDILYDDEMLDIDETSYIFMNMTGDHHYGVAAVYNDGESDIENAWLVDNDDNLLPTVTALQGNYPNPFNPETAIKLSLAEDANVEINIFNMRGQIVRTLVNEYMDAGFHNIVWNGTNDHGQNVASGVYFYNMKSDRYSSTKKMILMK